MMRAATLIWAVLATIAGAGLFLLKYQVQAEEKHLAEVRKDIVSTEQSIHVLKAEWSYLNDPVRLRDEAERYLAMHPMRADQIVAIDSIPMTGDGIYRPPGLQPMKKDPEVGRKKEDRSKSKDAAPARKPRPAGRTLTAKLIRPKNASARTTEMASSRFRP